jgi:hypothetical protein
MSLIPIGSCAGTASSPKIAAELKKDLESRPGTSPFPALPSLEQLSLYQSVVVLWLEAEPLRLFVYQNLCAERPVGLHQVNIPVVTLRLPNS